MREEQHKFDTSDSCFALKFHFLITIKLIVIVVITFVVMTLLLFDVIGKIICPSILSFVKHAAVLTYYFNAAVRNIFQLFQSFDLCHKPPISCLTIKQNAILRHLIVNPLFYNNPNPSCPLTSSTAQQEIASLEEKVAGLQRDLSSYETQLDHLRREGSCKAEAGRANEGALHSKIIQLKEELHSNR